MPHNITLNGSFSGSAVLNKTGGGTLTLGAANSYAGNTVVYGGTLALGASGTLTSPNIVLGTNTTLDVSQVGSFNLNAGQTLSGFGTVTGAVTAAAATIAPGSNLVTGTLSFTNGLTENGGVNNTFYLSSNPSGPNNDFINTVGGLTLSGSNNIIISGSLANGGVYPLFNYGGVISGDVTNFTVTGAIGVLSNSVSAGIIYFVNLTSFRAPTNVVWIGNATANNWDTEITTNWLDNGVGSPDIFVPSDKVLFNDLGAGNSTVNLPGVVNPSSVTVNTTAGYTLTGNGTISGTASLTVSNGTLNVLTTNSYTGPTVLAGGVLATPTLANSGNPSGIGAATADPANLIFNGGTLSYSGATAGTDHGIMLTNGGGTFDVVGGTTLSLNGTVVGNGGLTLIDTGTLKLAVGNTYTGNTTISNGTVNLNNVTAAGTGAIVLAGGTLDLTVGSQPTYANALTVNANSTLISAGGNNNIVSGAWTGGSNVTLNMNNSGTFSVNGSMVNFYGTVEMGGSTGAFRFNAGGGNTQYGATNATIDLGTSTASLAARNPGTMGIGALEGGSGTVVIGPTGTAGTLNWAIGSSTNNPSTTFYGIIKDNFGNENSAVTKIGSGTLTLAGASTYTAGTTVSSGTLLVYNTGGSGTGSGPVNIGSGGTLGGSGIISGGVTNQAGGTLAPGAGISTAGTVLTMNKLALLVGGTNLMQVSHNSSTSDKVVTSGAIIYGGTLTVVTNAGDAPFTIGDTFTLFNSTSASYNGSFTAINLPPLSPGLAWDTSGLSTNGTISVASSTPPSFSSVTVSGSDLVLNATNGTPGGAVTVLTSTNLTSPLSSWTTGTIGNFDGSGNYSYPVTGALSSGQPQQFYLLKQ